MEGPDPCNHSEIETDRDPEFTLIFNIKQGHRDSKNLGKK